MSLEERRRPLTSIILLCYNQEQFVGEAVEGILSQSYTPLEVIIFDDYSPDRTADVIERTIAANPTQHEVQFIRNAKNIGANNVVRAGLKIAKGDYIFVSHGDDAMLPSMVDKFANTLICEDVSLVTANAYYIDENSRPLDRTLRDVGQPADDSFEMAEMSKKLVRVSRQYGTLAQAVRA
jgi:glycosyltransferase involved in cell wall biosynthesis